MGRAAHLGIFARPSEEDTAIAKEFTAKLEITHLEDKFITQMSGGHVQIHFQLYFQTKPSLY